MVECAFDLRTSSPRRVAPGRSGVAEAQGWTLGVMNFSEEALSSLDTCHHLNAGQILTTTDASPLSHLLESAEGKSGEQSGSEGILMS